MDGWWLYARRARLGLVRVVIVCCVCVCGDVVCVCDVY